MRYQFFLCKEKHPASAVSIIEKIRKDGEQNIERDSGLVSFDIDRVVTLLREASGEQLEGQPQFRIRQVCGVPLLAVITEYRKAQKVYDRLSDLTASEGLSMYDGEMGCWPNIRKRDRNEFVAARLAHQRFMTALRHHRRLESGDPKQVEYYKIGECFYYSAIIDTAVMVLKGDFKGSVQAVNDTLTASLNDSETLHGKNGCFIVESAEPRYTIRFVVEGPRKSGPFMGWVEDGVLRVELLRRMSVYRGLRRLWEMGKGEEGYVRSRLYYDENYQTRGDWRNPADRFVDGIKTSEWLRKKKLDLIYGQHPERSHSEFLFYVDDEEDLAWDVFRTSSRLSMTEEEAAPLLGLIEDVIPYYYNYYYDIFHVRKEESELVLRRLKEIRPTIIKNPSDPSLGKIAERLLQSSFAWEPVKHSDEPIVIPDKEDLQHRQEEILFRHRFELLALLDFFAWWLESQQTNPKQIFDGFYVSGP